MIQIQLLRTDGKEVIKQAALLDLQYRELGTSVHEGKNINPHFSIMDDFLCLNNSIYIPQSLKDKVFKSGHDSKVTGHFGTDTMMKLIYRNFYWPKMEDDIEDYCNTCDVCQRIKSPRHAKHRLLHTLE